MTDQEIARRDIRRRQREVADRVIAADRGHGADRAEVNAALAAAGLPILEDEAEWVGLHDDEPVAEPNTILGVG